MEWHDGRASATTGSPCHAAHYAWHKELEPTSHSELFYELQDGPHRMCFLGFGRYLEEWNVAKEATAGPPVSSVASVHIPRLAALAPLQKLHA